MPVGRRFHYQLGGKGFILARAEEGGRSWYRTGRSDTPGQRSQTDAEHGMLPDELDHPEVWNDWSGGGFHPYRETGQPTYHWGENFDARFPRQLIHAQKLVRPFFDAQTPGPIGAFLDVPVVASGGAGGFANAQADDGSVLAMGQGVLTSLYFTITTATVPAGTGTSSATTNYGYTGKPALFGDYVYYPVFTQTGFERAQWAIGPNGESSTNTGALWAHTFAVVDNKLWKGRGNLLQSLAAGNNAFTGANWTATLSIGDGRYAINDIAGLDGQLFIGKGDGLYAGDSSGTFVNVLPQIGNQAHRDNCRDIAVDNGAVYVQHLGGITEFEPSGYQAVARDVGPSYSSRSPIKGFIRALRPYAGWMYAGLATGSQSYLLAGRRGQGGWNWHTMHRLPAPSKVARMHFDGISTGSSGTNRIPTRFWVSTDVSVDTGGTYGWWYHPIPQGNGNPLAPSGTFSPNYIASAQIDLGAVDWNAPGTPKIFRSVEVWADSLLSGYRYGDIYYDVDQSGSFTLLGRANTSPKSTIYFPTGEGSFVTGQSIELRLASTSASPAFTPVYRSIVLRGALQPRSIDMITAVTRIADGLRDMQGAEMRSAATMLQELRDFGNPDAQGTQAHQLIDLAGATQWVKVLGRIEEREVWQQGEDNPEIAATVRLAVLTFS